MPMQLPRNESSVQYVLTVFILIQICGYGWVSCLWWVLRYVYNSISHHEHLCLFVVQRHFNVRGKANLAAEHLHSIADVLWHTMPEA